MKRCPKCTVSVWPLIESVHALNSGLPMDNSLGSFDRYACQTPNTPTIIRSVFFNGSLYVLLADLKSDSALSIPLYTDSLMYCCGCCVQQDAEADEARAQAADAEVAALKRELKDRKAEQGALTDGSRKRRCCTADEDQADVVLLRISCCACHVDAFSMSCLKLLQRNKCTRDAAGWSVSWALQQRLCSLQKSPGLSGVVFLSVPVESCMTKD